MKIVILKGILTTALVLLALSVSTRAQDGDNDGCSNATLVGDYAFTLHGESLGVLVPQNGMPPKLLPFANPLPADGVAMTHFKGNANGDMSQVDFVMRNGSSAATPTTPHTQNGFRSGEWGTYNVKPDCTGTFTIYFPDTTEIDVAFVLGAQGREVRTVVTRQHVPLLPPAIIPEGASCAAETGGCDLGVQIRSEGIKLGARVFPNSAAANTINTPSHHQADVADKARSAKKDKAHLMKVSDKA
jgi:hypothetical protein